MANPNKMPVHCNVDTCIHWSDHFCTAKELGVSNMSGKAHTSDGTCCDTFTLKNQPSIKRNY